MLGVRARQRCRGKFLIFLLMRFLHWTPCAMQGSNAAPGMAYGKVARAAGQLSGGNVPPLAGRAGASVDSAELDSR